MTDKLVARKQSGWKVISMVPDICLTPKGGSDVPVPYPVIAELDESVQVSDKVFANGHPVLLFDASKVPRTEGDSLGKKKGIRSKTVEGDCWPIEHSATVLAQNKHIIRHDDLFWMNGAYEGGVEDQKAAKANRFQERKDQIEAARQKAKDMPPGPERDRLLAAADRFEKNNEGIIYAEATQYSYKPDGNPPLGLLDQTDNTELLAELGIDPKHLDQARARVLVPDPTVFGEDSGLNPIIAFKGSTPDLADWAGNNFPQGLGFGGSYYEGAVNIGTAVGDSGQHVMFVGHSLGGGLADAAGQASGQPATTFNSAGLHRKTVERYGGTPRPHQSYNYEVAGEILTGLQTQNWSYTLGAAGVGFLLGGKKGAVVGAVSKMLLSAIMPKALGQSHKLPGKGNPVNRHSMETVIEGIESQKRGDQAVLNEAFGK